MINNDENISRAATEIALMEMMRLMISESFFTPDHAEFRRRMRAFEEAAVSGLSSRKHFVDADDATNQRISDEASAFVTKIITSIRHPDDAREARS